jgi:putative membrane protein insertion efficiency factor
MPDKESYRMERLFILAVRLYQKFISKLYPPVCRFYPSCSHYSIEAVKRHGILSGLFMTLKRIVRCNPFSAGGYDPIL